MMSVITPKYIALAKKWLPSAVGFGTAGILGVVYVTDFKTVLQYVPVWNLKYRFDPPKE